MRNASNDWEVLDLTDSESKVLRAVIEHGTMSVSQTSRTAGVARTTVDAALHRLKERKLVRRASSSGSKGHVRLWKAVRPEKVKKELQEAAGPFDRNTQKPGDSEVIGGIDSREIGISVFHGKRQIMAAYERMLGLAKAERVIAIQGNTSAISGLGVEREYLFSLHERLKKAGVIMEAVNGTYVKKLFTTLKTPELESHFGRLIISRLLPDKYMNFGIDALVLRDTVIFIDIRAELVITIRYMPLVEMFNNIAVFLQESGERFNLNNYLKELIEQKKKS